MAFDLDILIPKIWQKVLVNAEGSIINDSPIVVGVPSRQENQWEIINKIGSIVSILVCKICISNCICPRENCPNKKYLIFWSRWRLWNKHNCQGWTPGNQVWSAENNSSLLQPQRRNQMKKNKLRKLWRGTIMNIFEIVPLEGASVIRTLMAI